jgi:hypothetical protein
MPGNRANKFLDAHFHRRSVWTPETLQTLYDLCARNASWDDLNAAFPGWGASTLLTGARTIIAELRGSRVPYEEHKVNALAFAAMPELVEVLKLAENYFGDLPSSDKNALRLHGRIVRALSQAGIALEESV